MQHPRSTRAPISSLALLLIPMACLPGCGDTTKVMRGETPRTVKLTAANAQDHQGCANIELTINGAQHPVPIPVETPWDYEFSVRSGDRLVFFVCSWCDGCDVPCEPTDPMHATIALDGAVVAFTYSPPDFDCTKASITIPEP